MQPMPHDSRCVEEFLKHSIPSYPMAESGYPSIIDTEEFQGRIGKTEEFSLYCDPRRRYFMILTMKIYAFHIFLCKIKLTR